MEMEEHSPGQAKPAKLPTARCERPLSHLGAWLEYGTVWCERSVHRVACSQVYTCCTTGHIPTEEPPLPHSPALETGAISLILTPYGHPYMPLLAMYG